MRLRLLRRLTLTALAVALASGCRRRELARGQTPLGRFLHDRGVRRAALEASLVRPYGRYADERLALYATPGEASWERLPMWNPPVAAVVEREGAIATAPDFETLAISSAARRGDPHALRALGERAFSRYPVQASPFDPARVPAEERRARGLFLGPSGQLGGLVRVRHADGSTALALTCASCHARPSPSNGSNGSSGSSGTIAWGLSNDALDLGRLIVDAPIAPAPMHDAAREARLLAWGPGRVDVTTSEGSEPLHVPDLRPVRFERHLQQSGAVVQRDATSLAVRIETLIVTSHGAAVRPPREVALGLALYLDGLADALPAIPEGGRGAAVFASACGRCHEGDGLSGGLVSATRVGTDPAAARSLDRGTGAYRIPSLRGLGARALLMHDASVHGLDDLLDPARVREGRAGHRFGFELSADDRAALLAFLRTL